MGGGGGRKINGGLGERRRGLAELVLKMGWTGGRRKQESMGQRPH